MDKSCEYLFNAAGQTSLNGSPEGALRFLDQCICAGPTPDLALLSYVNLHNEIWKAFGLKHRDLNGPGPYRAWAIRAEEANSRALEVHESYSQCWQFDSICQRALEMAENNAFADGGVMRGHTEQEYADALASPGDPRKVPSDKLEMVLECLRLPWDQQEVFVPGNWNGFPTNNNHFPDFIIGKNAQDQLVRYTCNPARLSNSQRDVPNAPHHMEEVYFRTDVLNQLYEERQIRAPEEPLSRSARYELRFQGGWVLPIIFDREENIIVAQLGEIGRCIPWQLRKHFAEFNTP